MRILGIDPGNVNSAVVIFDSTANKIVEHAYLQNHSMLSLINVWQNSVDTVVIEQVASMGMAVGESVFETVFWSGRFAEACQHSLLTWDRIKRGAIKMHLCGSMRAKDGNIRQALIDRFGEPGTKKHPGKTYGLSKDKWAALAVAVTWSDLHPTGIVS